MLFADDIILLTPTCKGLKKLVSICQKYADEYNIKGIEHLNIIFSYMKFNKICNLDYPIF